eukprot:TRINITY_DN2194_c0_g3_i6.p3 TRINITY_DN2194_c0_g3~~TRINITY_DN2194_c0_g3_i6.p3  ORF type:complete len:132 (-),score=29.72 TRINITY_DN2194_c0_g3_i6:360-755(-)
MIGKIFKRGFSKYILAIDEGTTSCRAVLFNSECRPVEMVQKVHSQITPKPGWVENDPVEIMHNVNYCVNQVVAAAQHKHGVQPKDIVAAGVTNQRETTIPWVRLGLFLEQKDGTAAAQCNCVAGLQNLRTC